MSLRIWWKCIRDAVCLERMHRAFKSGLMEYGASCLCLLTSVLT
jgi:hypothetical protein